MSTAELKIDGYNMVYKGVPPFMKYEGGYGYQGVLLEQEDTGKLQCHICGKHFMSLPGHIYFKHGLTADEYKKQVGLNLGTPIVSESISKKIRKSIFEQPESEIKRRMEMFKKTHTQRKEGRLKAHGISGKNSQFNNKHGTCPEQVKEQFWEIYHKHGRIPFIKELNRRLRYIIEKRFSGYEEACVAWGVTRAEFLEHKEKVRQIRADTVYEHKAGVCNIDLDYVRRYYLDYFGVKKRLPSWGEVKLIGAPCEYQFRKAFGTSKSNLERMLKVNI